MDKQRRGPWSKADRTFIEQHHRQKSAKEIAAILHRNEDVVRRYIAENCGESFTSHNNDAHDEIKASLVWKQIKQQFSREEQELFLYHWGRIITQFKDDVYPTEELQVIDTIKLEIMMNRLLTKQAKMSREITDLELEISREESLEEDSDKNTLRNLRTQLGGLRAGHDTINRSFKELLERKNNILNQMKATREDRIKEVESSKKDWSGLMRRIMKDRDFREEIGTNMERMRLSMEKEYEKFTEYHKYADDEVDIPILTPESVENKE